MGWDVFISHASEDKAKVAVPLKQALEQVGISAWIDCEQIKPGDGFRTAIDLGLQRCRFGVVILSPQFFKKSWAKAELDAFFNMEMSTMGQKRLLTIVYDMSIDDLRNHSPLLAGRQAVLWKAGLANVVQAIAETVEMPQQVLPTPSTQAPPPQPDIATDSLALLFLKDGRMVYLESTQIESCAEGVEMIVKCPQASDSALIQELDRNRSILVGLAFGTTAILGRVNEARLKMSAGQQIGILNIKNQRSPYNNPMEMSLAGVSADQLAKMRAERILLNEKLSLREGASDIDTINQQMLETFVSGLGGAIKVSESPLPALYPRLSKNPDLFVAVAKLAAVLFLCLSDAVEDILHLEMHLEGQLLHVKFTGRRIKRFVNMDAPIIEIKGTLDLANPDVPHPGDDGW